MPPSRSYTVTGNSKLAYPQIRVMKMNFPEEIQNNRLGEQLRKGEAVTVVGASQRRGHLLVESNGKIKKKLFKPIQSFFSFFYFPGVMHHVPFQYLELVKNNSNTVVVNQKIQH